MLCFPARGNSRHSLTGNFQIYFFGFLKSQKNSQVLGYIIRDHQFIKCWYVSYCLIAHRFLGIVQAYVEVSLQVCHSLNSYFLNWFLGLSRQSAELLALECSWILLVTSGRL